MPYSIIPPILIVLSLIGIIVFLMKKSSKVAALNEEDFSGKEIFGEEESKPGFFGKIKRKAKVVNTENAKHSMLGVLEIITRRSRVIFLKLESKFGSMSNSIRSKRKERQEKVQEHGRRQELDYRQGLDYKQERDIIQKLREYQPEKRKMPVEEKTDIIRRPIRQQVNVENEIKPIISERVVKPKAKTEIKDRLEELLIERIAANPRDIEAYERLGEYYLEIKSYKDAKECYKQVIKLNPAHRSAKNKLRRLENLLEK